MNLGKVAFITLLTLVLAGTSALAGVVNTSTQAVVSSDQVVSDNLFMMGRSNDIRGTIEGDLICTGRDIDVSGSVQDNIYAAAQDIRIRGQVGGDLLLFSQTITVEDSLFSDLRGACQHFTLRSYLANDLAMAAQSILITPRASIGGDVYAAASTVEIEGTVSGKVVVGAEKLVIRGVIAGDVEVWVKEIYFQEMGRIDGDLIWHDENPPDSVWANHVGGTITHDPSDWKCKDGKSKSKWPGKLFALLTALISTIFLIGFFKPLLRKGVDAFAARPWVRLGVGVLGVIVMPVAAAILIVLTITLPVGLILLGLYPMFLYISWLLFAIAGGTLLLSMNRKGRLNLWLGGLLGVFILWLLALIPVIGGFICFLATLFGFGILLHGIHRVFFRRDSVA